jgi:hypothetical protein
MDFTVNSKIIASFQPQAVQLVPLLGNFELGFLFSGTVHGKSDDMYRWLAISGARVALRTKGGGILDLGLATSDCAVVIRQGDNTHGDQFTLRLVLQPYQIDLLEAARGGSDLNFKLKFFARGSTSKSEPQDWEERGDMSLEVHVPESVWARQMNESKADQILLFEVRLPTGSEGALAHPAARHLVRAHQHLTGGNWRECVSECRQFAEELGGDKLAPALDRLSSGRKSMTKDEREMVLVAALQHYGHLAAHSESKHGELDFDRADAKLALSIAASLASHFFRRD